MYLYFCEHCNKLVSKKDNSEVNICSKCQNTMIPLNKTVEEWNGLTTDEMRDVVDKACEAAEKEKVEEIKKPVKPSKPEIKVPQGLSNLSSQSQNLTEKKESVGSSTNTNSTKMENNHPAKQAQWSGFFVFAIILYIVAAIMLYKGIDKMTNYDNSKYSGSNVYVGGDAYNFIINGTYSTGFFVLSMGCLMTGTICLVGNSINNNIKKNKEDASNQ